MTIEATTTIFDSEEIDLSDVCVYFTDELRDPDSWTFPTTNMGVDGVEIVHKGYGLWKNTRKNNIGRIEGTSGEQVIALTEDVQKGRIDRTCQPVYIDIDTTDQLTGGHRFEVSSKLNIPGWMFVYAKCRDQFARETFAKALNNERLNGGPQKQNDVREVEEHIKKWILKGKIKTEQDIQNQIDLLANPSLLKVEREKLCRLMVDFIHNNGIASFKPNRFCKHGKDTWESYKSRSLNEEGLRSDGTPCEVDPYATSILDENNDYNTHFYNVSSGTHINTILTPASKVKYTDKHPHLDLQMAVDISNCKDSNDLKKKRKKVIEEELKTVADKLDDLYEFRFRMGYYSFMSPDCQHAFLAQDHQQEYPEDGQFILYNDIK